MHSSRMHTARSFLYRGVSVQGPLCPGGGVSLRETPPVNRMTEGVEILPCSKLRLRAVNN